MTILKTVNTDQADNATLIPTASADPTAKLENNSLIWWIDDATDAMRAEGLTLTGDPVSVNLSSGLTLSQVNDWSGQQNFIEATLTDAPLVEWNLSTGQNAKVTVTADRTINAPTNLKAGGLYTLRIIQDGSGGWTPAYNAVYKFPSGASAPIDLAASASTIIRWYCDGTNLYYLSSNVAITTSATKHASCNFYWTGAAIVVTNGFNVASVIRNSAGDYTVTYATAHPLGNPHLCMVSGSVAGASENYSNGAYPLSSTTASVKREKTDGAGTDPATGGTEQFSFIAFL